MTLISGPTALAAPANVRRVNVQSASEMLAACEAALPADGFIACAAVADWQVEAVSAQKMKKRESGEPPVLKLVQNTDILKHIAHHPQRPELVIGFAAETEALAENARRKRLAKGCDWLLANDVSGGQVFGQEHNRLLFLRGDAPEEWQGSKKALAEKLADAIIHKGHNA